MRLVFAHFIKHAVSIIISSRFFEFHQDCAGLHYRCEKKKKEEVIFMGLVSRRLTDNICVLREKVSSEGSWIYGKINVNNLIYYLD